MKAWLADIILGALRIVSKRAYLWAVDPDRHARIRFAHRERWYSYKLKADQTKNPYDEMLARAWAIEWGFETSPLEAMRRGDLDIEARKMAMQKVDEARARCSGPHQP